MITGEAIQVTKATLKPATLLEWKKFLEGKGYTTEIRELKKSGSALFRSINEKEQKEIGEGIWKTEDDSFYKPTRTPEKQLKCECMKCHKTYLSAKDTPTNSLCPKCKANKRISVGRSNGAR